MKKEQTTIEKGEWPMREIFNIITDPTKKRIYEKLAKDWIEKEWIHRTIDPKTGKPSNNSFTLSISNMFTEPEILESLITIFDITDSTAFKDAFKDATHGSGQEIKRISVMHSSALCALLCFYRVSDESPITIDNVKYNKVLFEVQNTVFDNPSNIDIVLVSKEKKQILFLESKFSEYLYHGQYVCSQKYEKVFEQLNLKGLGYEYVPHKDDNSKIILSKSKRDGKNNFYIGGIKQMIAHFKGIESFCQNKVSKDGRLNLEKDYKDYQVTLGEILFDAWSQDNSFTDYQKAYENLATCLNENANGFSMLNHVLTYQKVFGENQIYKLDKKVKEYYNL